MQISRHRNAAFSNLFVDLVIWMTSEFLDSWEEFQYVKHLT